MSRKKTRLQSVTEPPQVRRDVAGIDISPEVIYVAVDASHSMPVRRFGTFTGELRRIADWLRESGVRSVAMESTGVYWIPLYQVLEECGIEVCLVNARHYKNVPGRKTDVCAMQGGCNTSMLSGCCKDPSVRDNRSAPSGRSYATGRDWCRPPASTFSTCKNHWIR